MKKIFAAAAVAGLAGLTACSISTPVPVPTQSETSTGTAASAQASSSKSSTPAAGGGAKAACELFNSLYASYKAVQNNDPNAFEDIYLQSQEAKGTISGDLRNLFASLSLLAIDHSAAAERNGGPEQESKDAVRDAVFANAGTCTAEGVTLRL
jgi:hypothetical protein